jgi:GGDEF domain-containing protein
MAGGPEEDTIPGKVALAPRKKVNYLDSYSDQKLDAGNPALFMKRMLAFCKSNENAARALLAGNLQLLGFEHVRDSFGEKWPQVKARIHLLTEMVIKKHISREDVYVLANDEQFIVLFAKSDKAMAERRAKRISEEVNQRLHGFNDGTEALSTKAIVLEVPAAEPEKLASVNELAQSVEEARAEKEAEECRAFEEAKEEMRLTFWPVANIRKRLVSMYQANVVVPDGQMPDLESESGALEAALDTFALGAAVPVLVEALERKRRAFLIVPVHLETLDVKRFREAYIDQCRELPQVSSKRLLLMIDGIPDDVPQSKLHRVLAYVAPFVAGFVGRFHVGFDRGDKLGGVSLVGMAANGASLTAPTEQDGQALSGFVKRNRVGRSRGFYTDAANFDAASLARKAGFDYVQGAAVAPAMSQFGAVFSIT